MLFHSDWSTALGNSLEAVSDGGRWDLQSADFEETMEIIASAGLDFPTANVYRVIATEGRQGWSMLRKTGMPFPAVGESRYYRWYIRMMQPDGLGDEQTHPIQDGNASSQTNWMFIVYNGGGAEGIPAGQWRPDFWATSAAYPNQRWYGPHLDKDVTYRIELHVERISETEFQMHPRIYDSAGTLLADDDDYVNPVQGVGSLASTPNFPLTDAANMDGLNAGNNGITPPAPFPFTYAYEGAFAVCSTDWCGAYANGI